MTDETFAGFEPSNTTPVPDVLFDELLTELSGAELKVVLYIIRRTWGFKKETDAISFNQFLKGITTKDGRQLDKGCGIQNRTVLSKALADLEKRGYIKSTKGKDPHGDKATTLYGIRFRGDAKVVSKPYHLSEQGSIETVPPVVSKPYHGSNQNVLGVVSKPYLQETVSQLDSLQETVKQGESNAPASLSAFVEHKKATGEHPAITQEMLAALVIPPALTLPSKQTPSPQRQVGSAPDVAPPAQCLQHSQAGAGEALPPMALTAKQIKQQNERRAKEIWGIIERERQTKYTRIQRELYENSKGMECLLEDQVEDDTIIRGLKAMDIYQRKQFTVLKFYGWLPNLTANEGPPPQNGKSESPVTIRPANKVRSFNGIAANS